MLQAPVPRNLRVRASIQLASARVPARAFLIATGLIVMGGLAVVGGADLSRTIQLTGALIVVGLVVFELRVWGRATPAVARLMLRQLRRARQVRLHPIVLLLPPEASAEEPARRPRWRIEEDALHG